MWAVQSNQSARKLEWALAGVLPIRALHRKSVRGGCSDDPMAEPMIYSPASFSRASKNDFQPYLFSYLSCRLNDKFKRSHNPSSQNFALFLKSFESSTRSFLNHQPPSLQSASWIHSLIHMGAALHLQHRYVSLEYILFCANDSRIQHQYEPNPFESSFGNYLHTGQTAPRRVRPMSLDSFKFSTDAITVSRKSSINSTRSSDISSSPPNHPAPSKLSGSGRP